MYKIKTKPLTLNSAYRGRRFTTPELKYYKEFLNYKLPALKIPKGKLKVTYIFEVSSKNCDGDNLIKCFQDAIATKYGFNDREIYEWQVKKIDVKKGLESISFEIEPL